MSGTVVIGRHGQVAASLARLRPALTFLARPDVDLARPETVGPALDRLQPELVINAAAYTAVDRAESEPELALAVNGTGVGAIAQWCAGTGASLIHISTDYVFDGSKAGAYVEDDPMAPLGAYGRSKLAGEMAVAEALSRHVILRTAWVHSPFGANFVKTMLRLAAERDRLRVVDDQLGSPTCALDLAHAILLVAKRIDAGMAPFGLYHWVNGGTASWADFAVEIFSTAALERAPEVERIATVDYPTPAARPANSVLSTERFVVAFGNTPPSWQQGLQRTLRELDLAKS